MSLIEFLARTEEYQALRENVLLNTAIPGFLLTLFTTLKWQLPGVRKQLRTLREAREKPEGLNVILVLQMPLYFWTFFLHSVQIGSLGGIVNALIITPVFFPILWRLWQLQGFRSYEWGLIAVTIVAIPVDLFLEYKTAFFQAVAALAVLGGCLQPVQMLLNKSAKGVNPEFPLKWFYVCSAWTLYGLAIMDTTIFTASLAFTIIYGSTYRLYWRYAKTTPPA